MSSEKMKVLEMIEKNIITVEEGLKLLESIEEVPKESSASEKIFGFKLEDDLNLDDINTMKGSFKESIDNMVSSLESVFNTEIKSDAVDEEVSEMFEDEMDALKGKVENVKDEVENLCSDEENTDKDALRDAAEKIKDEMKKMGKDTEKIAKQMGRMGSKAASMSHSFIKDIMSQVKEAVKTADFNIDLDHGESIGELKMGDPFNFDVASLSYLDLQLIATDVSIMTEHREDVEVTIYGRHNPGNNIEIYFEDTDGRLIIKELKKSEAKEPYGHSSKIEIKLPSFYRRHFSCKTLSGDLSLNYLDVASFKFVSVSGDLNAEILYGKTGMVKTTSGDCEIDLYKGDMMFNSISGDCYINYEILNGDVVIKTISGDIELVIPKNSEFNIEMKSISGDLNCDFPVTYIGQHKRGRIQGQFGSDAHLISAVTTSGDLSLRQK